MRIYTTSRQVISTSKLECHKVESDWPKFIKKTSPINRHLRRKLTKQGMKK